MYCVSIKIRVVFRIQSVLTTLSRSHFEQEATSEKLDWFLSTLLNTTI